MLDNSLLTKRPAIRASDSPIRRALAYGVNAPSPHNTQAWKFKELSDLEAMVYLDEHRLLPATDPPGRQMHVGCGCLIETLAVAASGMGYEARVEYLPEGPFVLQEVSRKPLAKIALDRRDVAQRDELCDFIFERQTNRKNYVAPLISDAEIGSLRGSFTDNSVECVFINDPERMSPLFDIFSKAMEIECMTRRVYEETRIWYRFSEKERAEKRDGLSTPAMGIEGIRKWFTEFYLNGGNPSRWFSKTSINAYLGLAKKAIETSQGILLIQTATNTQLDWVKTGRAYARIGLSAAKQGLFMQPCSQVLQEYPEMKELQGEFNRLLGVKGDEKVQMATRIGRGKRPYYTYRRNLSSLSA